MESQGELKMSCKMQPRKVQLLGLFCVPKGSRRTQLYVIRLVCVLVAVLPEFCGWVQSPSCLAGRTAVPAVPVLWRVAGSIA